MLNTKEHLKPAEIQNTSQAGYKWWEWEVTFQGQKKRILEHTH